MPIKKERFKKTVVSPFTGQEYLIRRVDVRDYLREAGALPIVVADSVTEQLQQISDSLRSNASVNPDIERRLKEFAIKYGVVKDTEHPGIWFGEYGECPEDEIAAIDLGSDLNFLAAQVCEFSFEMSGLKDMEKFFRGTGAGDSGPRGEEVRSETVIPASEGNA